MVLAVATSSGSYGAPYQSSAALRFLLCLLAIFSVHTRRWLVDIRRASHHWTCGSTPSRMKATSAVANEDYAVGVAKGQAAKDKVTEILHELGMTAG